MQHPSHLETSLLALYQVLGCGLGLGGEFALK